MTRSHSKISWDSLTKISISNLESSKNHEVYFQCLKIFSRFFQRFPQIENLSLYFRKTRLLSLGGVFFRRFGISSGTGPWEPKNMASGRIRPIGRLRVKWKFEIGIKLSGWLWRPDLKKDPSCWYRIAGKKLAIFNEHLFEKKLSIYSETIPFIWRIKTILRIEGQCGARTNNTF